MKTDSKEYLEKYGNITVYQITLGAEYLRGATDELMYIDSDDDFNRIRQKSRIKDALHQITKAVDELKAQYLEVSR